MKTSLTSSFAEFQCPTCLARVICRRAKSTRSPGHVGSMAKASFMKCSWRPRDQIYLNKRYWSIRSMQGCARESPRTLWPHMDGAVHTFLPARETNACLDHSTHGHVSAMFFSHVGIHMCVLVGNNVILGHPPTNPHSSKVANPNTCQYLCNLSNSLEVNLPTIWTNGKAEVGRVRKEKSRREKIREEKESEERRCRCANR